MFECFSKIIDRLTVLMLFDHNFFGIFLTIPVVMAAAQETPEVLPSATASSAIVMAPFFKLSCKTLKKQDFSFESVQSILF